MKRWSAEQLASLNVRVVDDTGTVSQHARSVTVRCIPAAKPAKPKRSKYGNRRTVYAGIKFDSAAEARRYQDLALMQTAGEISELSLQRRYEFVIDRHSVGAYVADFVYRDAVGFEVVEDVKSPATKTPLYKLKKKMMLAIHGKEIREAE